MKLVELDNSTQVRDGNGRLIATFPDPAAAKAFKTGYDTGIRDAAERFKERTNQAWAEVKGLTR